MNGNQVQHITSVDPDDDWKKGALGFLSRTWTIVGWVATNLIGVSVILKYVRDNANVWIVIPITLGTCGTGCLWFLRYNRKHRTISDHQLHALCHHIRDEAAAVLEKGKQADGAKASFLSFNKTTVQYVAEFFQVLVSDRTVTCAIRLANTGENGEQSYVTVARSSGMESVRGSHSVPIPASQGLPGRLSNEKYHGVLIINDIQKAIETADYMQTPNDSLPDCKSVIVSPINGWSNGKKEMIGILTVASRKKGKFQQWHTTSLKAIADILGLAYPVMLARLSCGRKVASSAKNKASKRPKQ